MQVELLIFFVGFVAHPSTRFGVGGFWPCLLDSSLFACPESVMGLIQRVKVVGVLGSPEVTT